MTLQILCEKIRKRGGKIKYGKRMMMNQLQFLQCKIT